MLRGYEGEPIASLHLVYYDHHAPQGYIEMRLTTLAKRDELFAEDPADFWDGWGNPGNIELGEVAGPLMDKCYEFISVDGQEESNMKSYRDTLAAAALSINSALPQSPTLSSDFVVVLGDGSRWTGGCHPNDVLDCISPSQRQQLIENGYWDASDQY